MKKLIFIACSVAALHVYSSAIAQNQGIASVKYSPEKANVDATNTPIKEAVAEDRSSRVKIESDNSERARTSHELRKDQKKFDINGKVGPNGEDIFLKGSKYYYLDSKGKKVKVKNSQLKDRAKHS